MPFDLSITISNNGSRNNKVYFLLHTAGMIFQEPPNVGPSNFKLINWSINHLKIYKEKLEIAYVLLVFFFFKKRETQLNPILVLIENIFLIYLYI